MSPKNFAYPGCDRFGETKFTGSNSGWQLKTIKKIPMKYFFIMLGSLALVSCGGRQENKTAAQTNTAPAAIRTVPVMKDGLSIVSKLPAQLAAYEEVSIFPKVNGYVKNVLVDIGSKVSKDQLLMTLEAPELQQASASARAEYEKAKSDYEINKENYNRLLEASKTEGAVSAMDLALDRSKVASSLATMNAAQANWQEQEVILQYLQVRAPFSGIITARNVHPGALVSNSVKDIPMLELKQESHLRLQIDVPENIAADLKTGDSISFDIPSLGNKGMRGAISRISENVNPQFRSERVELDVMNDGTLNSGMYVDVTITTKPLPGLFHVPLSAVNTNAGGKYVIVRKNNQDKNVGITTFHQNADSIEIQGALDAGDSVVVGSSGGN